jgi:hypothetical protein
VDFLLGKHMDHGNLKRAPPVSDSVNVMRKLALKPPDLKFLKSAH